MSGAWASDGQRLRRERGSFVLGGEEAPHRGSDPEKLPEIRVALPADGEDLVHRRVHLDLLFPLAALPQLEGSVQVDDV